MSPVAAARAAARPVRDAGTSRGFTLVEILVAMVLGGLLLAAVVPIAIGSQRANDRQEAVRTLQAEVRLATEFLQRAVRNAESVHEDSGPGRLVLVGGEAGLACGVEALGDPFWIEVDDTRLVCGPHDGTTAPGGDLAGGIRSFQVRYGVDATGDGVVSDDPASFPTAFPAVNADDVLAVHLALEMVTSSARAEHLATPSFVSTLRGPVLGRTSLGNPAGSD